MTKDRLFGYGRKVDSYPTEDGIVLVVGVEREILNGYFLGCPIETRNICDMAAVGEFIVREHLNNKKGYDFFHNGL